MLEMKQLVHDTSITGQIGLILPKRIGDQRAGAGRGCILVYPVFHVIPQRLGVTAQV